MKRIVKRIVSIFALVAMLIGCCVTVGAETQTATDAKLKLLGYQRSAVYANEKNEPVQDLRIVALGNDETVAAVGFSIAAEDYDKQWDKRTTTVFRSLSATDSKGNTYTAVTAADEGYAYVYALVIKGVPAAEDVLFDITPYYVDAEGTRKTVQTSETTAKTRVVVLDGNTAIAERDGVAFFTNGAWTVTNKESKRIRFKTSNPAFSNIVAARFLYSSTSATQCTIGWGGSYGGWTELAATNGKDAWSAPIKLNTRCFDRMNNNNSDNGMNLKLSQGTIGVKSIWFYVDKDDAGLTGNGGLLFGTHLAPTNDQTADVLTLTPVDPKGDNYTFLTTLQKNPYAMGTGYYFRLLWEVTGETDAKGTLNLHDGWCVGDITGVSNTNGYTLSKTYDMQTLMVKNNNFRPNFHFKATGFESGLFGFRYINGTGTCKIKAIYFFDTQAEADAFVLPNA